MMIFVVGFLSLVLGGVVGGLYAVRRMARIVDQAEAKAMHNLQFAHAMVQWVHIKQQSKSLATALEKRGYRKIAVYGMADVGERFISELQSSTVEVSYGIDQNAKNLFAEIELFTPDEKLPEVDAIIVTPIQYFDAIEEMLTQKVDYPVLSVEDLMYEV